MSVNNTALFGGSEVTGSQCRFLQRFLEYSDDIIACIIDGIKLNAIVEKCDLISLDLISTESAAQGHHADAAKDSQKKTENLTTSSSSQKPQQYA